MACLSGDENALLMSDLCRGSRTTSRATRSARNWHFLLMRVFIILSFSTWGTITDRSPQTAWSSWLFVWYIRWAPVSPCGEKVCFWTEGGFSFQSFAENNLRGMSAFEKVICAAWPLKTRSFLNHLVSTFLADAAKKGKKKNQYPTSGGWWILTTFTAAGNLSGYNQNLHFYHIIERLRL